MQARFRLRRPADFARVRARGQTRRHPLVILGFVANDVVHHNLRHNRYGVIVSRRVGKAVKRNRARRLLREALRQNHAHIRPGYDIVCIARPPIVGQRLAAVNEAVRQVLAQAGLLIELDA